MLAYKENYLSELLLSNDSSSQEFISFLSYALVAFIVLIILNILSVSEYWVAAREKERNIRLQWGASSARIVKWLFVQFAIPTLLAFVISQVVRILLGKLNFFLSDYINQCKFVDVLLCLIIACVCFIIIVIQSNKRKHRRGYLFKYALFFVQMTAIAAIVLYIGFIIETQLDFTTKFDKVSGGVLLNSSYAEQEISDESSISLMNNDKEYTELNTYVEEITNGQYYTFQQANDAFYSMDKKYSCYQKSETAIIELLYISERLPEVFEWKCVSGELFSESDYYTTNVEYIPVLLGNTFDKEYSPGDIIEEKYIVRGILEKNTFYLNPQSGEFVYYPDEVIVIPMGFGLDEWSWAVINHLTLLEGDKQIEQKIIEKNNNLGLPAIVFKSMEEQIKVLDDETKYILTVYGMIVSVILMLCITGHISTMLYQISSKKREYAIRIMCGATIGDLCFDLILPIVSIIVVAYIIAACIIGQYTNLSVAIISAAVLSIIILFIPIYRLKHTTVVEALRVNS